MKEEEEAQSGSKYNSSSWRSKTNWTIADGSLVDSITVDSSFSPTVDDQDHDHDHDDQNADKGSTVKSPIILFPPSPDHVPCEITITFAQKREVRQVYVRSTARVYEIYCTSDLGSSNEYLCTVRCGIASRDEEVLCTPSFQEVSAFVKRDDKGLDGRESKSDCHLNTSEDEWVEVKAVASPQLDDGNCTVLSKFDARQGESVQDLYEATVEINDADPCMSITLRMLSLQDKGCIFVNEIYVFGDLVESCDTENTGSQMENPASSSLMAMFMSTLLQLSKTRSAGQIRDDQSFDITEKQNSWEIDSKSNDLINATTKLQRGEDSGSAYREEEKLQEIVGVAATPARMDMPPQVSDAVCKLDSSCSRIENFLDQLDSRVSRIEDFLLRFEERMLKPINSIDARLQRVEQQLEELTKKPQNYGLRCCTRISAPDFSWHESDDNFCGKNEGDAVDSDEKDYTLSIPADDLVDSVNDSQSDSSVLATAPAVSNVNGKEESNTLEAAAGSSKDKPKHALSVDDALASALAGFLSSASVGQQRYTQALAIKAPDFLVEEDGKRASAEVEGGRDTGPPICFNAVDETDCTNESLLTSSDISCLERGMEVIIPVDDHLSEKTGEVVDDRGRHNEEGKEDSLDGCIHSTFAPSGQEGAETNLYQITDSKEMNNTFVNECETGNQFLENHTAGSEATEERAGPNSKSSSIVEVEKQSDNTVLQVLKFSHASSILDFEAPILDVKFMSGENSNGKSPFEALLARTPESKVEAPCGEKANDDDSQIAGHNLISVDDSDPTSPSSGKHFSVDMNYLSLNETPLYTEGEKLHDYHTSNNKGDYAESLI